MRIVKPSLYLALGMAVGIAATVAATPAQQQANFPRISVIKAGTANQREVSFVKDATSGGCWIVLGYSGDAPPSVAVAPAAACHQ